MIEPNLTTSADNDLVQEKDATVLEDPGDGMTRRSDGHGNSIHEIDESHAPESLALHKKLLEIAEAGQTTNAASSAEFSSLLLSKGSEINAKDLAGKTALHVAIEYGLKDEAQTLIEEKADVGIDDDEGQQPLYLACEKGNTKLVSLLLNNSAIVNAASINGETPLATACRKGHTEIVKILLNEKADTKISDKYKWSPLHWASWNNHEQIVEHLLGVDTSNINATEDVVNWTPLNVAASYGHEKIVCLLLDENADLYIKDKLGRTPLMTATRNECPEVVRMILHHQKDRFKEDYLEIRDDLDFTPLHFASMRGSHEIASQLIDAGAKCDSKWKGGGGKPRYEAEPGWTPLHFASFYNHSKIVSLLLPETPVPGVDAGAAADDGRTPLHLASLRGNELIVKMLFQRGASIHATDETGLTPLHLASGAKAEGTCVSDSDLAPLGPNGDIDPDLKEKNAEANSERHLQVVEFLLQNQASPKIKATNGDTALHCAAALGERKRIDVLLKKMKAEDFSWGDWKESPVRSALGGSNPPTAMKSLLAKQEIKKAPFWKGEGRIQVIATAAKNDKPYDILDSIFRELQRGSDSSPEGCKNWGPFQWAAHERLPDILSVLVEKSGYVENVDQMVHEALQITCNSIASSELWSKSSRELLVQVMWILITNSERTPENTNAVRAAHHLVRGMIEVDSTSLKILETVEEVKELMLEELMLLMEGMNRNMNEAINRKMEFSLTEKNERLRKGQETSQVDPKDTVPNFEGHVMKDIEPHTRKNVKGVEILSTLQDILKDPPFAQISQTHQDEVDYSPPIPRPDHQGIVQKAEATVVGFFKGESESGRIRRNRPIQEIVYDPGPTNVMGTAIRNLINVTGRGSLSFNSKLYAKENLKLKWVHLPSTNMVWMNDLLTSIMSYEGYPTREYYEVRSFFRDSWVEVPDRESLSRMMRPRSVMRPPSGVSLGVEGKEEGEGEGAREKNENNTKEVQAVATSSQEDAQKVYDDWKSMSRQPAQKPYGSAKASAIYMLYLAYSTHCRHWDNGLVPDEKELKEAYGQYKELLGKYKDKDKPQHGSPTLDEWYYQFAPRDEQARDDQNDRNQSQVVSKYLGENTETNDAAGTEKPNEWTVVRVNQLWIWTISEDWIITATSSSFERSPDALVEDILNQLSKQAEYGGSGTQPASADELVPVILDYCIGSYERRPSDKNRISIGQTFSHYINSIGRDETTLFNDFSAWSLDEHPPKKGKAKANRSSRIQNTTPFASRVSTSETKQTKVPPQSQIISAAIDEAKSLYCDIKDVRDELNILKSVAQYQQIVQKGRVGRDIDESGLSSTYVVKNLQELDSIAGRIQSAIGTTLSLQQSDVANRQATEATRQGKTVMTFTFATVLFLPLSFLSSLFALDVASFQEAPAWAFYVIFFVSMGISAILGYSVFHWENIVHFTKNFKTSPTKAFKELFIPTSTPLTMPERSQNRILETEEDIQPPSIVSKMEDRDRGVLNRLRGHRRKNDTDERV